MTRKLLAGLLFLALSSSAFAADPIPGFNLSEAGDALTGSIFGIGTPIETDPTGDTYSAAPLAQDGASAFFISDTAPNTHTFDVASEAGGMALAASAGSTWVAVEGFFPGVGPNGGDIIAAEYIAVDAAGAPTPWVAAGVTAPGGLPFTTWRLDIGSTAAGPNEITNTDAILSSGFTAFDSAFAPIGSFPLTLDTSSASGVSGAAIVGLSGADIAGFDLASIQLFWEVVPEPATGLLTVIGLLGVSLLRRRS